VPSVIVDLAPAATPLVADDHGMDGAAHDAADDKVLGGHGVDDAAAAPLPSPSVAGPILGY
jgi:hypothetical protein